MKRTLALILIAIMLFSCFSCQPTPTEEIVVNKGDDELENKLNATPVPTANATAEPGATEQPGFALEQHFPASWQEEQITAGERFVINIDAEVVTKADGLYPVLRTKDSIFDNEWEQQLAQKVLGAPAGLRSASLTKGDWAYALQKPIRHL